MVPFINMTAYQVSALSLFDLPTLQWDQSFDLIVITGVLYPQYIAQGETLAYTIIDNLLKTGRAYWKTFS